ncbi:replicative DNA helicase [Helicobacter enhydrae]|uniref:Replicative DNA helicase n=1 Tax=Helicobacter enhydrae TaxID=222136 RepID=A0A1B1U3Z9_9HELI|nr:replicative DNA helicase [Helicobacter enhydrae]ANV97479.1 replicative DNA helicase [Helicobacter enhydrae]
MEQLGIHNIERAFLSTLLFDPSKFEEVEDLISKDDFSDHFYQAIFEVMQKRAQAQLPIHADIIASHIRSSRFFNEEEFLNILALAPLANLLEYAQEIKNASIKRSLHSLATFVAQQSLDGAMASEDILQEVERRIYSLVLEGGSTGEFRDSKQVVENTIAMILKNKKRGNSVLVGLNTGFHELNRITTGFNPGELIIIGARPSMGKTTFALNMVQKFLTSGCGVAFFSLEMSAEHLMLRMLSAMTSIHMQNLKTGELDDLQWENLNQSANVMQGYSFYVDDNSFLNVAQFRSKLRKLKAQDPRLGVVVVDYLQLMQGNKRGGGENKRHEEVSEISRSLKILARELQIPIIALSQLNRSVESRDDKRPQLSDLRESGSIEQDADMILFLYRDEVYAEREYNAKRARAQKENKEFKEEFQPSEIEKAEIIVAKNRNGEVKTVRVRFNKKYTRFEDHTEGNNENQASTRMMDFSGAIEVPFT